MKLLRKALCISIALYVLFAIALWISVDGEISGITSDLDFYNHYLVTRFPDLVSDKALLLEANSTEFIAKLDEWNFTPTPFYSIIFLAPFWWLQSEILLWLLGTSVGCVSIYCFYRVLQNMFSGSRFLGVGGGVTLLLLPLNFNFIVDSVAVSTMSVAAAFVLGAFAVPNKYIRSLLLICAAMVRSNFLVALMCLFISLLLIRPKRYFSVLIMAVPSMVIGMIFYKYYYSTYPGGAANFLFYSAYQGIDYTLPSFASISRNQLGYEIDILDERLSPLQLFKLLTNWDSLSFLFNVWILKISIMLGFVHEKLFISEHQIFITKLWRTGNFIFLTLPGTYALPILILAKAIPRHESCLYCWALVFILSNSLLQGDPRYLMGTYFVLALALVRLVFLIKDSDVSPHQARLHEA